MYRLHSAEKTVGPDSFAAPEDVSWPCRSYGGLLAAYGISFEQDRGDIDHGNKEWTNRPTHALPLPTASLRPKSLWSLASLGNIVAATINWPLSPSRGNHGSMKTPVCRLSPTYEARPSMVLGNWVVRWARSASGLAAAVPDGVCFRFGPFRARRRDCGGEAPPSSCRFFCLAGEESAALALRTFRVCRLSGRCRSAGGSARCSRGEADP